MPVTGIGRCQKALPVLHFIELGQMVYQHGKWNGYMNSNTILNGDDVAVLIELIEREIIT